MVAAAATDEVLSEAEIIDLYRTLGDDYAQYGLSPPEDADHALIEGYEAGRQRHGRTTQPDRFSKKWIQLRHQALRRNRSVSPYVTCDILKLLDVSICPVSLVLLTHGKQKSSDWSVDRINNYGAYAIGNISIMSTHVNKAKGIKTIDEVKFLSEGEKLVDGLTSTQWARLQALMFGPCILASGRQDAWPLRQACPLPAIGYQNSRQVLQVYLVKYAVGPSQYFKGYQQRFLEDLPNNQLRGQARRMMKWVSEHESSLESRYDAWLHDELFDVFVEFFPFLFDETGGDPTSVLGESCQNLGESKDFLTEFRLPKRGRLH